MFCWRMERKSRCVVELIPKKHNESLKMEEIDQMALNGTPLKK